MSADLTYTLDMLLHAIRARQRLIIHDIDVFSEARKTLRNKLAEHIKLLRSHRDQLTSYKTLADLVDELDGMIRKIEGLKSDTPSWLG